MTYWPRPERLLPPRLVEALGAALAGEAERARQLAAGADPGDPLVGGVVRLVRGLAMSEAGAEARALLGPLVGDDDPALALAAATALVERECGARRFVAAARLLRRASRLRRPSPHALFLESLRMWLELQRRGRVEPERLATLARRLERRHPAAVHAAVHLLRAESALLSGDPSGAVAAQREARPYAQSAGHAPLGRRYEAVTRQLRAPFAEVEDWVEPLRPLSREEVADLESRPWQIWVDTLHRRVLQRRTTRAAPSIASFARSPQLWDAFAAALASPRRTVSWAQARDALRLPDIAAARQVAEHLARQLRDGGGPIAILESGYTLRAKRFVFLFASARLPAPQQRLLAFLAERPATGATELAAAASLPRHNAVRHLARLRQAGFVRLVGGGNEGRYVLV